MNRRGVVTRGAVAAVAIGSPLSAVGGASAAPKPIRTYEVQRINVYHGITADGTEASRSVALSEIGSHEGASSFYVYVDNAEIENFPLGRKAHLVWAEEN